MSVMSKDRTSHDPIALLCLGRLSEALEGISKENDVARQDLMAARPA